MASSPKNGETALYISIDVGTRGVRGAVHDNDGAIVVGPEARVINVYQKQHDVFEQSSTEIWSAVCDVVKTLCSADGIAERVRGIGFDATCSLVVVGKDGKCLSVSVTDEGQPNDNAVCDIILWADHRALEQAERINKLAEDGKIDLRTVGGKISPEMEPPKLMWLKEHNPDTFNQALYFFDLCDYLTWRATGKPHRSLCSTVCKWQYRVDFTNIDKHGWNTEFWDRIGLGELLNNNAERIGQPERDIHVPGAFIPGGLSQKALREIFDVTGDGATSGRLSEGVAVAVSVIDAHAGGLGMLFCNAADDAELSGQPVTTRIAVIAGTSTCHMASSEQPVFVRGVWGPYGNAMLPRMWLNEAGQSAAGELIDHVISTYSSASVMKQVSSDAGRAGMAVFLNDYLKKIFDDDVGKITLASRAVLVYPDFHGNRSPFADPHATGIITGLRLVDNNDADAALERLAIMYVATVQALAYETRKIMDEMSAQGYEFTSICMGGGLAKNWLYVQSHADIIGLPVLLSEQTEPMLVGSACLAAAAVDSAQGRPNTLSDVCKRMAGKAKVVRPFGYIKEHQTKDKNSGGDSSETAGSANQHDLNAFHDKRYELTMHYLRDVDVHVRQELSKLSL